MLICVKAFLLLHSPPMHFSAVTDLHINERWLERAALVNVTPFYF